MRPHRFRLRGLLWAIGAMAIILAAVSGNVATQRWIHMLRIERQMRRAAAETDRPGWAPRFHADAQEAARTAAAVRPDPMILGCQVLTALGLGWAMILLPLRALRRAIRATIRGRTHAEGT